MAANLKIQADLLFTFRQSNAANLLDSQDASEYSTGFLNLWRQNISMNLRAF